MPLSIFHIPFEIPNGEDKEQFCNELKFFAKIIYVITGYCSIEKETIIQSCTSISHISGYLSIICWLFAQLPQVIKNHERKSVEGVSLGFLACWFAGDFLNFASCIMTGAMAFQVLLSGYYCIIDIILGSQCYYYSSYALRHPSLRLKKNQRLKKIKTPNTLLRHKIRQINNPDYEEIDADENGVPSIPLQHITIPNRNNNNTDDGAVLEFEETNGPSSFYSKSKSMSFSQLISSSFIVGFSKVQGAPIYATDLTENFTINIETVGKILAWSCTCLYLSSRVPQLITNYKQKSTKGVSILLFLAALSGNTLYSISLLTCREALEGGLVTADFWNRQLSYFLGASMTVGFDLVMLFQWYCWDYNKRPRRTPRSRSGRIHSATIAPVTSNPMSLDDATLETARSPIVILSPHHARKLSELIPLSPHDFLIDSYVSGAKQETDPNKSSSNSSPRDQQQVTFAKRVQNNYGSF